MRDHGDETLFVALDVESATVQHHICQIGLAWFTANGLSRVWKSEINPEVRFDGMSQCVHGLSERDVETAPTFPEISQQLAQLLDGSVIVTHSNYDLKALQKTAGRYDMRLLELRWLDSCEVAKQMWPTLENHSLPAVAAHLGVPITQHHNALDDAIVAGEILMRARNAGFEIDERTGRAVSLKTTNAEPRTPDWVLKPDEPPAESLWA
jgi:DNA polymerase-3 subunit epsilon